MRGRHFCRPLAAKIEMLRCRWFLRSVHPPISLFVRPVRVTNSIQAPILRISQAMTRNETRVTSPRHEFLFWTIGDEWGAAVVLRRGMDSENGAERRSWGER